MESSVATRSRNDCWTTKHTRVNEVRLVSRADLHVMLEQDHHLFSTLSTTSHCAATAKARLSSPLVWTSTAGGEEARAAAARWPAPRAPRPSEHFRAMNFRKQRAAEIEGIRFLATDFGKLCKQNGAADSRSKISTAASSNITWSHVTC